MKAVLGFAALAINTVGYGPYVRDIIRGKVRPHRVTWGIWTILTIVAAVNQIKNGGGYSSLFFVSTAFLVTITFLLSLKFGQAGISKFDALCLTLALVLLAYWVGLRDTRLSTFFAVVIDTLGAIPTVLKVRKHPETETYIQWLLAAVSGLLTIFAVTRLDWVLIIYPLYIVLMNSVIMQQKFVAEHK